MAFINKLTDSIRELVFKEVSDKWETLKFAEDTIVLIGPYEIFIDSDKIIWASNGVDQKEIDSPNDAANYISSCIIADITYV